MKIAEQKYFTKTSYTTQSLIPVLHIIKSLGRGGAEMLLPESLNKHSKEKFSFHYIYFLPWKNQMVEEIEKAGGVVVCFPAKNNIGILMNLKKIIAYVKEHKIQLIHCHLPWAGIVGRLVGRITGIPVVYTEHNKWERYHKLTYYINKLSFSSQQRVIAVSEEVAKSIKSHYNRSNPQVQVILNGIDTEKFSLRQPIFRNVRKELNIPDNAIVVGLICVFRVQKRLPEWLEIASMVHANHPEVYFILVGDGVLREQVHEKAKILGVEKYVRFAGLQKEVRPWLKAMDIFMMSSEFEGLPIALLEAMSMNCIPVCTDAGGIPEIIKDGINGLLVPVNHPLKLADRLSAFLYQPQRVAAMKIAARERIVQHFSMNQMVTQLEAMYDTLILNK